MDVAIQIPDEVGRALAAGSHDVSRAVLEAVALHAYRIGTITTAQVQEMSGLRSRWHTEEFLGRAQAYYDYTLEDLDRDIAAIRKATGR